jgi:YfiH family protein
VIHSSLLSGLDWIDHGFGTRLDIFPQDQMASVRQIHSNTVLVAASEGCAGDGDALATDRGGVRVSVRTADCYPLLLADVRQRAVAAVHAGWRGTAARIVGNTIGTMRAQFGTDAADVYAAIGPGIGACCYQVGIEVARQFGLEQAGRIDLADANRRQLLSAGVPLAQIQVVGGCTRCDARQFHSFRRDGEQAGRMISFIGIR